MNLHVFNDSYGLFPSNSAKTISKLNAANNIIVNLAKFQTIANDQIVRLQPTESSIRTFIAQLPPIEKIILHPLTYQTAYFLLEIKKRYETIKVYWVCWSYEIYNYHFPKDKIYLPFSFDKAKLSGLRKYKEYLQSSKFGFLVQFFFPLKSYGHLSKAYSLVDYFCSFLEEDFYVAQSISKNQTMRYLPFSYLTINEIIDVNKEYISTGNLVMLGHSASLESNHYEMIMDISAMNIKRNFLIPLAYGDKDYSTAIQKIAKNQLQGEVEIITDRLSSTDYYAKLQEVKHAVFNLRVQQALGNILGLLYLGAKVFLREETTTYKQFKKWGIIVYAYSEISQEINLDMTPDQIKNNRDIIVSLFNEKRIHNYWLPLTN